MTNETKGLMLGLLGVVIFGLTLPMTRIAVAELDPIFVGLGRAILAAVLAGLCLIVTRQKRPRGDQWRKLAITIAGVIFGFPLLSALALRHATAGHGGVIISILPLATAIASVVFNRERPSAGFWFFSVLGSCAVAIFAGLEGAFHFGEAGAADLLLLGAVVAAAIGYAQGADLARELGGWQVISWALVLASPLVAIAVWNFSGPVHWDASWKAWGAFLYVAVFSQFLGFFAWYAGLALGGVAKVGQVQLLQTFVTLIAAALLVGEKIGLFEFGFALLIVAIVALGRRMRVAVRPVTK